MRALRVFVYAVVILMLLPVAISLPVALTATRGIRFPPEGLTIGWFVSVFQDTILLQSIWRSFLLALIAGILAVVISLPWCFVIERGLGRGRDLLETLEPTLQTKILKLWVYNSLPTSRPRKQYTTSELLERFRKIPTPRQNQLIYLPSNEVIKRLSQDETDPASSNTKP